MLEDCRSAQVSYAPAAWFTHRLGRQEWSASDRTRCSVPSRVREWHSSRIRPLRFVVSCIASSVLTSSLSVSSQLRSSPYALVRCKSVRRRPSKRGEFRSHNSISIVRINATMATPCPSRACSRALRNSVASTICNSADASRSFVERKGRNSCSIADRGARAT
jgi:hypothetical protein